MTKRKDPGAEVDAVAAAPVKVNDLTAEDVAPAPVVEEAPIEEARPRRTDPSPGRQTGLLGPLLGGAIAAAGGFALSHFDAFGISRPIDLPDIAALETRLDDRQTRQAAMLDTLAGDLSSHDTRLAALEAAPAPVAPDLSLLDDLEKRLAILETAPTAGGAPSAALAARLTELEQQIAALPQSETSPDLQKKLDAALVRLTEAEGAADARAAEAAAVAEAAAREKALETLTAAVLGGSPFAPELQAMNDPTLTSSLGPVADTGVPTLAGLQSDFPDAARNTLQISRDLNAGGGWGSRLVDFLASQTGARSLAPQEGDDPDAILSRAEFALSEGRVADAVTELQALDPAVRKPLDAWIGAANTHVAATAALQSARGE